MEGEGGEIFFLAVVPAGVRLMWKGGEERGGLLLLECPKMRRSVPIPCQRNWNPTYRCPVGDE